MKFVKFLLCVLLAASLAGCGGTATSAPAQAPPSSQVPANWLSDHMIEVTAAGPFGLNIDYQEIITWQEWQDRLGIKFEMVFHNGEDWRTQFNLMLASDNLPDIIFNSGLGNADMADYGGQGFFVNFLDYENLIPNIKQAWADYPGLRGAMTTYDGKIYGTKSVITSTVNKICRSFINQTWLDNVGKQIPKTIDELYDVLTAFKEQDANGNGDLDDEIPMGYYSATTGFTELMLLAAYGINTNTAGYILQADGGNVYLANTTEAYKAYLTFMNKCFNEGLIDEQCFTLTNQEIMLNCENDLYGVYATGSAPYVMVTQPIAYDAIWPGIMGLTSEYNQTPTLGIPSGISGTFTTLITADKKYEAELVRFIDYLHGEEGGLSTFSGYEGSTFDYIYDELLGIDVLTIRTPEGFASSDEFRQYKAVFNGIFLTYSGIPVRNSIWYDAKLETLKNPKVIETYGWIAQLTIASRDPRIAHTPTFPYEALSYNAQETEDRITPSTDVSLYLTQSKTNFIIGNWDINADWDRYLNELDNAGLTKLMEIEQAAWSRYYAAQ